MGGFSGNLLYDHMEADATGAVRNLATENGAGEKVTGEMSDLLVEALRAVEAPAEQLVRLGLS
jgi:hypothetical protein